MSGGDAGQIGAARGRRKREGKTNQIVIWIADDGLVEIANLDMDTPLGVGERAEIACMTVAADPHRGTLGDGSLAALL